MLAAIGGLLPAVTVAQTYPAKPIRIVVGHLNYSSAGTGTTTHIADELLSYMVRIQMTHIPYRGTGQQLPALLSGEVALAFGSTTVVPLIQARKLVLLGVTGAKRFPGFPDAPTIGETVPGYEVTSWNAMFAPAGTPPPSVKRISEQVGKGPKQADALKIFEKQGLQESAGTPEELGALVAAEVTKWAKVIQAAHIPLQ